MVTESESNEGTRISVEKDLRRMAVGTHVISWDIFDRAPQWHIAECCQPSNTLESM